MSDAAARAAFLKDWLAAEGGSVRFDQWMRQALYHPALGYYTSGIRDIGGARADFSTWPARSHELGRAVARWIRARRWKFRGQPLIEIGPGNGALAAAVLRSFHFWNRPRLALVETSPVLRAIQAAACGRRASWHEAPASALEESQGGALIFSNELADAFPCRVFRREPVGWSELHIGIQSGHPSPEWKPAPNLPSSTVFERNWPAGQVVEIHESFRDWLASWCGLWRRGRFLIVDYGAPDAASLYHRRPSGTLRGYFRHQRLCFPELLEGFGRRDLTADINFADLRLWAQELGLRTSRPLPLHEFLAVPAREDLEPFLVLEIEAGAEGLREPGEA
ncbi:MAG: SAM-dependent methyltransferase [Terrimicrobiaceae bacterium]|nr:SAM-dependent methyltransferase [Terrimicrobiaceae bacterium]